VYRNKSYADEKVVKEEKGVNGD